jgi:uncharacterized lipoprotein YbaY
MSFTSAGATRVLTSLALLVSVELFSNPAAAQSIAGTAAYEARIPLPKTAVLEVTLEDVTLVDAPSTIASTRVSPLLGSPIAFTLTYDPQRIIHSHRYAVRGKVLVDAKPSLTSDATALVITYGSPTTVALMLRTAIANPKADSPVPADPPAARPTTGSTDSPLPNTSWQLVHFQRTDGSVVAPDDRTKYTIEFGDSGHVSVRLDCNRGRGSWKSTGSNELQFGPLALTRANCPEGSLHNRMVNHWALIRSFAIKDNHLYLVVSGGIYEFEPFGSRR